MVANINNFGVINFYENNASNQERTKKAEPQFEDITPVVDEKPKTNTDHFPFLTQKCYEEKNVEMVEAEFRAACKGTAESLWRSLWDNENIGYVEVKPYDATTIYRRIEKWYGKLPYSERNFRGARNKR